MGKLDRQQVQDMIEELEGNLAHPECLTCDCFQGFLTQLKLDCSEDVSDLTGRFKVPLEKMHGCLGCEPCPPGSRFAEYLKSQKINKES